MSHLKSPAPRRGLAHLLQAIPVLAGLTLAAVAAPRAAESPMGELRPLEIDRREEVEATLRPGVQARLRDGAAWRAYAAGRPAYQVRWDEARETPERLTGPGAVIPGVSVLAGSDIETVSRRFVTEQGGPWLEGIELKLERSIPTGRPGSGPGRDRLAPAGSEARATGWWVHFSQNWNGVPVWGSRLTLRITRDGRVPVVSNRTYRDIDAPTRPALPVDRAVRAAAEGFDTTPTPLVAPSLAILPIRRAAGMTYRLAWRVETRTDEPIGHWISLVDAMDGTLLWRMNNTRDAVVAGQFNAPVEPVTSDGAFEPAPVPHLDLELLGGWSGTATTDAEGRFRIETDATTNRTLQAFLAGPYGRIENMANSGATPGLSVGAADGAFDSLMIQFDDGVSLPSERDSWVHAMRSHDHIKTIEPGFTYLDYPMPIRVEIARNCNAFWDGYGINFFAAGGGCANTGRIATVIMHEYGHAITDFMYRPFFPSGAMHEGFSDYYAAIITNQPLVGQGFQGPGTIIRRIDTDLSFPGDATGEIHNDGLIVASALWDVREALGPEIADHLWHFARYGFSDNFDDYFFDYLVEDDDDGNIYNGTPHLGVIAPIFQAHGIGDFGIEVVHTPEPDTESLSKSFEFRARFFSIYPLQPGSVQLHATIGQDGPTQPVESVIEMSPGSGTREYLALLDPQPAGTTVTYYLSAEDTTGSGVTWPPDAPLTFRVGADTTPPVFQHEVLRDQPLDSPRIRAFARITDNLDRSLAATGISLRRNGGPTEDLPLAVRGATPEYQGEIPLAGAALGDLIEYRLNAVDSAGVANTGHEPATGFHAFRLVRGLGRDLEENDGGFAATGQFAWGVPSGAGPAAWSGSKVWGASLDSGYSDALISTLTLPAVDLTGWTRGSLVFRHWFHTEEFFDGGSLLVSTDGGAEWSPLTPDGDYNTVPVFASGLPGYSGRSDGWQLAEFDLSGYVGRPDVRFRFHFQSDEAIHGTGWFLDDIQVIERQTFSRPLGLETESGRRNRVPLRWDLPGGIVPGGSSPVLGYHVHRVAPGEEGPRRLTDEAVTEPAYVDATAQNGVVYSYYVSALYAEGESPLAGPAQGFPFTPVYAPGVAAMSVTLAAGASLDTTIAVANEGTGFLQVNGYLTLPGLTLDDIRYRVVVGDTTAAPRPPVDPRAEAALPETRSLAELAARSTRPQPETGGAFRTAAAGGALRPLRAGFPASWDTLGADADDASHIIPDFRMFRTAIDADRVYFGVDAFAPWGASNEFNIVVAISTDGNSTNGYSGGEYLLVAGNLAISNFGIPAILLTSGFQPVDVITPLRYADGDSTAEFGVSLDAIDRPGQVTLNVLALDAAGQQLLDRMPDRPTTFATLLNRYLLVSDEVPGLWRLRWASAELPPGIHDAQILVETSDPNHRTSVIPLTLTVGSDTPVDLVEFQADPVEAGVRLRWRTSLERDHLGFHVYRARLDDGLTSDGPGDRLTTRLVIGEADGRYEYLDEGAEPGRRYAYRLADLSRSGRLTFHAPLTVAAGPALPPRLALLPIAPNPMRGSAALRYALPVPGRVTLQVFGIDGKLVRNLARDVERTAGWHEHSWDGREDGGAPVPAGLYFVRLETERGTVSRKLIRAR